MTESPFMRIQVFERDYNNDEEGNELFDAGAWNINVLHIVWTREVEVDGVPLLEVFMSGDVTILITEPQAAIDRKMRLLNTDA